MKEGSIILIKCSDNSGLDKIFSKLINEITNTNYVHSSIYLGGKYNEFGIRLYNSNLKQGFYELKIYGDIYEPIFDLTSEQIDKMIAAMPKFNKYNFIKLVSMWFVYPLRWLWKKIKWVPFSKLYYGAICSEAIDSIYKAAGIDIIEGELEGYTTPGDLAKSNKFRFVGETKPE